MKSLLFSVMLCSSAIAAECPWVNLRGAEMMAFDSDLSVDKPLSKDDVESDLKCLKILFENFYVAQTFYGDDVLISRLNQGIKEAQDLSGQELMKKIFALHQGMTDVHLGYSLGEEEARFTTFNKKTVELSDELPYDVVHDMGDSLYFRPGSLINFSDEQKAFIELVGQTDKNLILDLRGNGGGDDDFAYALTEALFTPTQEIPLTKRHQVHSPLQRIGFSLTLLIHGYEVAEAYRRDVRDEVQSLPFKELLPFTMSEEMEDLKGKRKSAFKSKITLITDGDCASSCETIVEKLSAHPQTKVVGTNTSGALHFSNAVVFMLPHSGIVVRLPTLFHEYENDAPEGVGYAPDVETTYVDLKAL